MFWLDWKLFGNGHGMASPYFDDVFYWLVDTNHYERNRHGRGGRFYRTFGGLGAQLSSCEWRIPLPGTRRRLFGHDFVIYQASREWFRVRCSWALVGGVKNFEEVTALHRELREWGHGK